MGRTEAVRRRDRHGGRKDGLTNTGTDRQTGKKRINETQAWEQSEATYGTHLACGHWKVVVI